MVSLVTVDVPGAAVVSSVDVALELVALEVTSASVTPSPVVLGSGLVEVCGPSVDASPSVACVVVAVDCAVVSLASVVDCPGSGPIGVQARSAAPRRMPAVVLMVCRLDSMIS